MRRRKGKRLHLPEREPSAQGLSRPAALTNGGRERLECDPVTGDGVFDLAQPLRRARFHPEPPEFSPQGLLLSVSPKFKGWELPQMRVDGSIGPLADQESPPLFQDQHQCGAKGGCDVCLPPGQRLLQSHPPGQTLRSQRAGLAERSPRTAQHRSQLHQRLVQGRTKADRLRISKGGRPVPPGSAHSLGRPPVFLLLQAVRRFDQRAGQCPKQLPGRFLPGISTDAKQPGQHPNDVPVEHRHRLVEGNAADRPRAIAAHPRQRQEIFAPLGDLSPMPSHDATGGLLQMTGPPVIAQAFPEFQHPLRRRVRQGCGCWQLPHPALPVRNDRADLGLLQHDLRDPDRIRIPRPSPRQITGLAGKPGDEGLDDRQSTGTAQAPALPRRDERNRPSGWRGLRHWPATIQGRRRLARKNHPPRSRGRAASSPVPTARHKDAVNKSPRQNIS
jgi:hypothetical protein